MFDNVSRTVHLCDIVIFCKHFTCKFHNIVINNISFSRSRVPIILHIAIYLHISTAKNVYKQYRIVHSLSCTCMCVGKSMREEINRLAVYVRVQSSCKIVSSPKSIAAAAARLTPQDTVRGASVAASILFKTSDFV